MEFSTGHESIFVSELLQHMPQPSGDSYTVVDATLGAGGHAQSICQTRPANHLKIIGIDRDQDALKLAQSNLHEYKNATSSGLKCEFHFVNCNYSEIEEHLIELGEKGKIDFIYADLGVSSMQLDHGERGFSWRFPDQPLDMRMDQQESLTAADIVNDYSEAEIAKILFHYGEEKLSRKIASLIVAERERAPLTTIGQLTDIIERVYKTSYRTASKKNPATKSFQALRIAVNQELDSIPLFVENSFACLREGGRLAIISFHSLEDRLVKRSFNKLAKPDPKLAKLPMQLEVGGKIIKPFPMKPSEQEVENNPRSRSAKLRIIEKQKRFT